MEFFGKIRLENNWQMGSVSIHSFIHSLIHPSNICRVSPTGTMLIGTNPRCTVHTLGLPVQRRHKGFSSAAQCLFDKHKVLCSIPGVQKKKKRRHKGVKRTKDRARGMTLRDINSVQGSGQLYTGGTSELRPISITPYLATLCLSKVAPSLPSSNPVPW